MYIFFIGLWGIEVHTNSIQEIFHSRKCFFFLHTRVSLEFHYPRATKLHMFLSTNDLLGSIVFIRLLLLKKQVSWRLKVPITRHSCLSCIICFNFHQNTWESIMFETAFHGATLAATIASWLCWSSSSFLQGWATTTFCCITFAPASKHVLSVSFWSPDK